MIYLGKHKAGATVKYRGNFHNDTGTLEDPTSPEAQLEKPDDSFTALTAPAKINAKTGHFGGSVDTTAFAAGQYLIRMAGTVATAKTVATEFCFEIEANNNADIYGRIGVPAGASVSADIAAVNAKTTNLPTDPADESLVVAATDAIYTRLGAPAGASIAADIAAKPTLAQILAGVIEGTLTIKGVMRLLLAGVAGKTAGSGTATATFRDNADAKNRISATLDSSGNRTAVTLDQDD